MGNVELFRFDASVAVVGALNPAIVTPDWLARKSLISDSDRDECNESLQALTAQGLIAYTSSWFAANIIQQKFSVTTTKGSSVRLRDLAAGIFTALPETPVTALGINFHAEYKLHDARDYYLIGDVLSPKGVWYDLFPADKWFVGTKALQVEILEGPRPSGFPTDRPPKSLMISIEPSVRGFGHVVFNINNHADLVEGTGSTVVERLMSDWEASEVSAQEMLAHLVKTALESK